MSRFQGSLHLVLVVSTLVHGILAYHMSHFAIPPNAQLYGCQSPFMRFLNDQEGIEEIGNQFPQCKTVPFGNVLNGLLNYGPHHHFGPYPPILGYPPPYPPRSPYPYGLLGAFGYRLPPPMAKVDFALDRPDTQECVSADRGTQAPCYELFVGNLGSQEAESDAKTSQPCSKYKPSKYTGTRIGKKIKIVD